jgi:RNA polymerase sigma-70 factor (ECF subfamily)
VSGQYIRDAPLLDANDQLAVIRGLREGSRDAWARLYDSYSVDVWRYVARLLGSDAAVIGDVVQESFLDAVRSARNFDPDRGTLWSWLVGIAHHRVSAHWRQASRHARWRQLVDSGKLDVRHLFDGQLDANADLESRETIDVVRAVLAEMSSDYAALLTSKYLDDRSLAELAIQFGATVDAIKSKLARARRDFRAKFEFMVKSEDAPANRTA